MSTIYKYGSAERKEEIEWISTKNNEAQTPPSNSIAAALDSVSLLTQEHQKLQNQLNEVLRLQENTNESFSTLTITQDTIKEQLGQAEKTQVQLVATLDQLKKNKIDVNDQTDTTKKIFIGIGGLIVIGLLATGVAFAIIRV